MKQVTATQKEKYSTLLLHLDPDEYKIESWLLVQFKKVGVQRIGIAVSNKISHYNLDFTIDVHAPIDGVSFLIFSNPIANKTSNITFTALQVNNMI